MNILGRAGEPGGEEEGGEGLRMCPRAFLPGRRYARLQAIKGERGREGERERESERERGRERESMCTPRKALRSSASVEEEEEKEVGWGGGWGWGWGGMRAGRREGSRV